MDDIRKDCGALWRGSSGADAVLRRTVSGHGVCATDLAGEPARHRDLPVGPAIEALPHGLPRTGAALDGIRLHDPETAKTLIFLTNHFALPATTICALYKSRWQVELFFKWIKQHLRIKRFFGTSENAVKTQIWIAVSVYVLVAIVKKRLDLDPSLYTLLQIISVTLFEKIPINQALAGSDPQCDTSQITNQLNLFAY